MGAGGGGDRSMLSLQTSGDYAEVFKAWQYLYVDLVTKAHLIPDFDSNAWCDAIVSSLVKLLVSMRKRDPSMESCVSVVIH